MTFNQLKYLFEGIGNAHYFIKTTEFGDTPSKVEAETESTIYPAFYQVITDTINREQTVERTVTLIVCDLVTKDRPNIDDILSDTEQTLSDIIKILRQESEYYTLIGDPIMVSFKDRYGDAVAGWQADVTIETQNNSGYCDIPSDIFGYPGGSGTIGVPGDTAFKCSDINDCSTIVDIKNSIDEIENNITIIQGDITEIEGDVVVIDETLIDLQDQIDNITIAIPLNEIAYGTGTGITSSEKFKILIGSYTSMTLVGPSTNYLDVYVDDTRVLIESTSTMRFISTANGFVFSGNSYKIDSLIGSGNRMVVADASGYITTQAIPSSAALQETYIGFGSSSDTLTGSSDFTYDGDNLVLNPFKKFYVSGLFFDGFNAGRIYSATSESFFVLNGQFAIWGSYSTFMQLSQNNVKTYISNVEKLDISTNEAAFKNEILVTNKRSTIGGAFYAENNSFNLAGDGPIVASDNMGGRKIGLGYSPGANDYIWSAFDGMYVYGHGRYNVFIYSNGFNNASLHVEGKFRVGDTNFNTGHTAEIVGDLQVTDQAGTGDRLVEADYTGVQSAYKEIISAWITDASIKTELEDITNWDIDGQWLGTITGTYRGQQHYNYKFKFEFVDDDEPIRLARV